MKAPKILLFIVAYNAEKHITKVLSHISKHLLETYDCEILIIDDSSMDNTFAEAKKFQHQHPTIQLKILYNPDNQGYGGNQKLGYHYAIKYKFDIVVLLHGDGQYAPEILETLFLPIINEAADAVLGSRILEKGDALKGGMPRYKYWGNRILTYCQNKILKTQLSEFHSGYRAYKVETLKTIPFERNTNDFHFDSQIIIQLLLKQSKILEIPIPTYYGDEICYVNGFQYAWNVLKTTLHSRLHQLSILYDVAFDIEPKTTNLYDLKLNYTSSHTMAINAVSTASRVLDLGANYGQISMELRKKQCYVVGADVFPAQNPANFDAYIQLNLDDIEKLPLINNFDYVLILDVIEHLNKPESFMDKLRQQAKKGNPTIIITTPNIAFFVTRIQLLFGNFNYGKRGILDITHKRLFTFATFKKLCYQSGYKLKSLKGIPAPFPKALGENFLGFTLLKINEWLIKINKGLFSYQIYAEVEPTPIVDELLEYAIKESKKKSFTL